MKYLARFIMISEFSEMDLIHFHQAEKKYQYADNWYAISQAKLWNKYNNGFFGKKLKYNEKSVRIKEFEEGVRKIIWQEKVFDFMKELYQKNKKWTIPEKQMYYLEMQGCDWGMPLVQRVDSLIISNLEMRIDRSFFEEQKIKNKVREF